MILITGITGKTGGEVARQLLQAGIPFRAVVRNAEKATALAGPGVEIAIGDLGDARFLPQALHGVTRALLVMPNGERQLQLETGFIDAAVAAGVAQLVYLSSLESTPGTTNPITGMHVAAEDHLRRSGIDWTMVRPTFFMQSFLGSAARIRERSEIAMPVGQGRLAATDLRDVAAIICLALTQSGHAGQSYDLTGPELLTMTEVVARFSRVLGWTIRYVDQPLPEFRARLQALKLSDWRIDAVVLELTALANGIVDHTTDTVAELLGRPAASLEAFVRDHAALFSAPPQ